MSNGYTTTRSALQTALSTALTAYSWNAGPPPNGGDAVPDSTALGYVWVEHSEQDSANALLERITLGVRMYVIWSQRLDPQTPTDPTELEQAANDLQTTIAPVSATGTDPWYFEVLAIDFDNDNGFIEAEVRAVRWNDAAVS